MLTNNITSPKSIIKKGHKYTSNYPFKIADL